MENHAIGHLLIRPQYVYPILICPFSCMWRKIYFRFGIFSITTLMLVFCKKYTNLLQQIILRQLCDKDHTECLAISCAERLCVRNNLSHLFTVYIAALVRKTVLPEKQFLDHNNYYGSILSTHFAIVVTCHDQFRQFNYTPVLQWMTQLDCLDYL